MKLKILRSLSNAAALLGSGAVTAIGFTLLTSNRLQLISPAVAVVVVLFVQWQMLGLMVSKLGIDQIVFAAVSENASRNADPGVHIRRRTIPLALPFAVVVAWIFTPWAGVVCFLSLLLDTHSTIMLAELNARERYLDVATANLLNYPLFFVLVFASSAIINFSFGDALASFLCSSLARWLWLLGRRTRDASLESTPYRANASMGYQQLLNYLAYRSDQVLLATGVAARVTQSASPDFLRKYVFLARYPELVAGVMVALGGMLLPRLFMRYESASTAMTTATTRGWLVVLLYLTALAAPLGFYVILWRGSPIHVGLIAAFWVNSVLILPSYVITYSMIRQGYLRGLIRNLQVSVGLGALLNIAGYTMRTPVPLVLTVPAQLLVLVTLGLTCGWSVRTPLFGQDNAA